MTLSDIYDFNTISVNEDSSETESIETQISDDGILFEFDITKINIFDNSSLLISTIEAPETIQPEDGLITAPSLVGRAISSLGDLNLTSSYVVDFDGDDPSTWTAFDDNAGIFTSADILNDNLLDDGDGIDIGIVSDADPFFGLADTINGDAGNDLILGGTDQDFINGGTGNDRMSGGLGTDRFIFEADHGVDRIHDFEDGTDLIDLSALGIAFADLTLVQVGQNVEIDTGEGIIAINDSLVEDFDTTDFVF